MDRSLLLVLVVVLIAGLYYYYSTGFSGFTAVSDPYGSCKSWTDVAPPATLQAPGCYRVTGDGHITLLFDRNQSHDIVVDLLGHTVSVTVSDYCPSGSNCFSNGIMSIHDGKINGYDFNAEYQLNGAFFDGITFDIPGRMSFSGSYISYFSGEGNIFRVDAGTLAIRNSSGDINTSFSSSSLVTEFNNDDLTIGYSIFSGAPLKIYNSKLKFYGGLVLPSAVDIRGSTVTSDNTLLVLIGVDKDDNIISSSFSSSVVFGGADVTSTPKITVQDSYVDGHPLVVTSTIPSPDTSNAYLITESVSKTVNLAGDYYYLSFVNGAASFMLSNFRATALGLPFVPSLNGYSLQLQNSTVSYLGAHQYYLDVFDNSFVGSASGTLVIDLNRFTSPPSFSGYLVSDSEVHITRTQASSKTVIIRTAYTPPSTDYTITFDGTFAADVFQEDGGSSVTIDVTKYVPHDGSSSIAFSDSNSVIKTTYEGSVLAISIPGPTYVSLGNTGLREMYVFYVKSLENPVLNLYDTCFKTVPVYLYADPSVTINYYGEGTPDAFVGADVNYHLTSKCPAFVASAAPEKPSANNRRLKLAYIELLSKKRVFPLSVVSSGGYGTLILVVILLGLIYYVVTHL